MRDSRQPPARRGLSLGWRLVLSTALIIAVVMGGISVIQQLADIRKERAIHQDLLQVTLVPLATRLQSADSLTKMCELVNEFHDAHLGLGYAEHHVVLIDSAGSRVPSTLPPAAHPRNGDGFRASLRIRSPLIRDGQGMLTVLKGNEEFRAGVRRDWLLWLVHVVSTIAVVSLFLGVTTYFQVTRSVTRLIPDAPAWRRPFTDWIRISVLREGYRRGLDEYRRVQGIRACKHDVDTCCRRPFFRLARQNERGVAPLHERVITPPDGKTAASRRVVAEIAPLCVARHSFGATKSHSSRLDWRYFNHNSTCPRSFNGP